LLPFSHKHRLDIFIGETNSSAILKLLIEIQELLDGMDNVFMN
jgi:hypothetical protein